MTTNKGVNRTFLITFLIYVGGSFLWSLIGKRFVDSFYVDIAVSQLLVCVPPFVYLKISGTKTGELIPYKKIRISDALLAVVMTYLFYPLMLVMNLLTMFFVDNTSAELATTMGQENLSSISCLWHCCQPLWRSLCSAESFIRPTGRAA